MDYANYLRANKANAIVADSILGRVTPLFTGYSTINDAVPVPVLVNCHYGGTYVGQADQSKDAPNISEEHRIHRSRWLPASHCDAASKHLQSELGAADVMTAKDGFLVCYGCSLVDHCTAAVSLCS